MASTELERIALLAVRFNQGTGAPGGAITTGIGDDAAVLALASINAAGRLVWTVDAQVEGTHFRRSWVSWEDIGWRSFMAAASDLAAMGAAPVAALSSLVLADVSDEDLAALADGQAAAAKDVGAPIVGGNLARGTETSITTTLLGSVTRPVLRSGARPGDRIWLAGAVGRAAAGLVAIAGDVPDIPALALCKAAWRRPQALVRVRSVIEATSALDVSDGLARDAGHLAEASGVVLVLDAAALHDPVLAEAARVLDRDPLELALGGGEDYALLATSPTPLEGFVAIGVVEAGAPAVLVLREGTRSPAPRSGFDHFG